MFDSALFISDLHLNPHDPKTLSAFLTFLKKTASQSQALYILGDLFEFWSGDDTLSTSLHQEIVQNLANLAALGTQIFFMHGNRDFLIGKRFARAAHLTLLPDPSIVHIAGQTFLLSHGDSLCTHDKGYMRLRRVVQNRLTKRLFLALPRGVREKIARHIQYKGRERQKYIMADQAYRLDVAESAVQNLLNTQHIATLIHGHTHRPAKHLYPDGKTRWVLPDWLKGHGGYLIINKQGIALKTLDHQPFIPSD